MAKHTRHAAPAAPARHEGRERRVASRARRDVEAHRGEAGRREPYDPFADPFNDQEEFERYQEAEAERSRRLVLAALLLFVVAVVVLFLLLGEQLAGITVA